MVTARCARLAPLVLVHKLDNLASIKCTNTLHFSAAKRYCLQCGQFSHISFEWAAIHCIWYWRLRRRVFDHTQMSSSWNSNSRSIDGCHSERCVWPDKIWVESQFGWEFFLWKLLDRSPYLVTKGLTPPWSWRLSPLVVLVPIRGNITIQCESCSLSAGTSFAAWNLLDWIQNIVFCFQMCVDVGFVKWRSALVWTGNHKEKSSGLNECRTIVLNRST